MDLAVALCRICLGFWDGKIPVGTRAVTVSLGSLFFWRAQLCYISHMELFTEL